MTDLRYPVGKFESRSKLNADERLSMIEQISAAPARMRDAVRGLSESQLNTPYREGGWTVRQVVHHVPDSHLNGYTRLKLALTEKEPTIKPYDQSAWADLADSRDTPIETSLILLESVHDRWVRLLRSLDDAGFERTFRHPEHGAVTVDWLIAMYAWHGRHHVAHITSLRKEKGW
jgi:uncharacterized damage-inducible protein DinB